ncbi:N-acetylneuraminate lyase [Luteitalea sp. TBR-22]|uniref:dihydrodipicolinate synthase family protein n=1 Tax=Luteitalea sp. TBR-22 TaxID=2802971 RepID=UPI001EF69CAE|nr:dihydrodipicolinate synthase family protein [Luteitalea sp. TBR-22]BCS34237.2 N-acetylneuraminate lyase [Luteitalea sp. TBR-22]
MDALKGILPALITPFEEDGRVATTSLERLLARLFDAGVHGTYICGTTGEGLLMSVEQRCRVAEIAVANTPPGHSAIVHVGAASFEDARDLATHAGRIGATAISSLPPAGPGFGFPEARRYYAALAAASPLPLVVYYFPEAYPAIRTLDHLEEICALPNVAGVKFTDFDLSVLSAIAKPGRVVFNGRDEVLAAGLLMGAHGGIGSFYNLVPDQFVDIDALARAGRWSEVRERQDSVNALITAVLRFPLFPAIKQVLTWSGIPCGPCLVPRAGLSVEQQDALRKALAAPQIRAVLPDEWTG